MKNNFKIILFLLFILRLTAGAQTTSYNITVETVNTSVTGELDDIIPLAVIDANAGNAVTIFFDVQNGTGNNLVKLTAPLQQISIISGSITFKNIDAAATALTTGQGFQFNGSPTDASFLDALKINCAGGTISIDGLRFENFQTNGAINRTAIYYLSNTNALPIIRNSFFSNNGTGVLNEQGGDISVLNSIFQSNNTGLYCGNISAGDAVIVSSCTFQQMLANPNSYGIICESLSTPPYDALSNVNVNFNRFIDNDYSFSYYNEKRKDVLVDYLNFENNTIANTSLKPVGVELYNPIKSAVVKTNTISNCSIAFSILRSRLPRIPGSPPRSIDTDPISVVDLQIGEGGDPCTDCASGIDFTSQNTNEFIFPYQWFNIKKHNSDNSINSNCPIAFNVSGYFSAGVNILDQTIFSRVNVEGNVLTNIYNTQLQTTNPVNLNNLPINGTWTPGIPFPGNANIQPPQIHTIANLGGGNLGIHFSLLGIEPEEMRYLVSCYRSNAQGHILELLGTQEIDAIATSYYKTFNAGAFSIVNGDRVAIMVTSLGNTGILNAYAAGTSQPSFAEVMPPCTGNNFVSLSGIGYVQTSSSTIVCANNDVVLNVNSGITTGTVPTIYFDFGDGTSSTVQSYSTSITKNFAILDQQDIQVLISNTGCGTVGQNVSFKVYDCCCKTTNMQLTLNRNLIDPFYTGSIATIPNVSISPPSSLQVNKLGECDLPEGFPYTYTESWNWGDGSPSESWNTATSLTHDYTVQGVYNLAYNYTSNYPGCSAQSYSSTVNVSTCCKPTFINYITGLNFCSATATEQDPKTQPIISAAVCINSPIAFNMSDYVCPSEILNYTWDFGDGSAIQTGSISSHAYTTAGTYTLNVLYTNNSTSSCYTAPGGFASFIITVEPDCCPVVTQQINALDAYSSDPKSIYCLGNDISFEMNGLDNCLFKSQLPYAQWSFGDGATATGATPQHVFSTPGTYTITVTVNLPTCSPYTFTTSLTIEDCEEISCSDCIGSFAPEPGKYVFSMWVREEVTATVTSYSNLITGNVQTICSNCSAQNQVTSFSPQQGNLIIDGWQKVEGTFVVPAGTQYFTVSLDNGTTNDVYFDDIRIHPFNSSSKTYVYDPVTLRLSAELDENNYATFYEYDEEGALVRVKKETERGIKTIKEARNNIQKR